MNKIQMVQDNQNGTDSNENEKEENGKYIIVFNIGLKNVETLFTCKYIPDRHPNYECVVHNY